MKRPTSQSEAHQTPAPGYYNLPPGIGSGNKGKSITERHPTSSELHAQDVPGPGAYQPKLVNKESARVYSVGESKRPDLMKISNVPGPGAYDPDKVNLSYKFGFGTGKRPPLKANNQNPGPCEYNIQSTVGQAPQHVMAGRRGDLKGLMANIPGPGQYDVSLINKPKGEAHVIGTGQRAPGSAREQRPGPGTYDIRGKLEGKQYGFGTSSRFRTKKQKVIEPGPGFYDIPPTVPDYPKYLLPRDTKDENLMQP